MVILLKFWSQVRWIVGVIGFSARRSSLLVLGLCAFSCAASEGSSRHVYDVPAEAPGDSVTDEETPAESRETPLPVCGESLAALFSTERVAAPAAGAGTYRAPGAARRAQIHRALVALSNERWASATEQARSAGYDVCRVGDVAALVPEEAESGHARVAVRLGLSRGLVFEAPHPFHDTGTAEQARRLFERLSARALIVSGTYRCANAGVPSGHAGHTSACGGRQPYAVSDMAHNEDTIFHQAHVSLFNLFTDTVSVSLHGMGFNGVSVSNGTRKPLSEKASPYARFTAALQQALPNERITTCNGYQNRAVDYRLCGTTNLQGRYANGYGGASIIEPTRAGDRFMHLEQSLRVRRNLHAVATAFERWIDGA